MIFIVLQLNDINSCCNAFNESIVNEDIFNLFIKKKIRVFSHKTEITKKLSQSLFGDNITLRDLLNEKTNKIKNIIWDYLFKIYLIVENNKEDKNITRINKMTNILNNIYQNDNNDDDDGTHIQNNIIEIDNDNNDNDKTNTFIKDITSTFDDIIKKNKPTDFLDNLLNISKNIAEKYKDDIDNNNIDFNNIIEQFGNIGSKNKKSKITINKSKSSK